MAAERLTPDPAAPRSPAWAAVLAAIVSIGSVLLVPGALGHLGAAFARPGAPLMALGIVAVVALLWMVRRIALLDRVAGWKFLLGSGVVFLATRLAVLAIVPAQPVSDFSTYRHLARRMATGEALPAAGDVQFFCSWGYSLALAPLIAWFGDSLLVAKLFNVAAGFGSLFFFYRLAGEVGGPRAARAATMLYLFWPPQLFLTPVLASEHLALLLALACLTCVLGRGARSWAARAISGGVLLGAAMAVRPALGVLLPVGWILLTIAAAGRRRAAVACLLMAAGTATAQFGYRVLLEALYGRTPPNVAWWNLMAGLNYDARGRWNQADSTRFFAHESLAERNAFAREQILRRLADRPWRHLNLVRRKMLLLWADNYFGVYWATQSLENGVAAERIRPALPTLFAWSQLLHIATLILCAAGAWRFVRAPAPRAAIAALLLIAAGSALHAVFETQTRYAYVFTAGVIVLAATAQAVGSKSMRFPPAPDRTSGPSSERRGSGKELLRGSNEAGRADGEH